MASLAVDRLPGTTPGQEIPVRFLLIPLAIGLAVVAAWYHFIMIEQFVVVVACAVLAIAINDLSVRRFGQALTRPTSLMFLAFLLLYMSRLNMDIAASAGSPAARLYYEMFAVFAYFVLSTVLSALRTPNHVITFLFWFLGTCLALEMVGYFTGVSKISNPNIYAYQLFTFVPFLHIRLVRHPGLAMALVATTALTVLVGFGSRNIFLGLVVYLSVFAAWRWISVSRFVFRLFCWLFVLSIIGYIYVYIFHSSAVEDNSLLKASEALTAKGSLGRLEVWAELVDRILVSPVWGLCSNCNTEYFMSATSARNISSHNTYLEIAFRSGLVGLFLFVMLLARVINQFFKYRFDRYARIGASFVFASILISSAYEFMMFSFISANLLFWLAVGLLFNLLPTQVTDPGVAIRSSPTEAGAA